MDGNTKKRLSTVDAAESLRPGADGAVPGHVPNVSTLPQARNGKGTTVL